jgi:RNA polymerase sigma-70 factor (ECF subfamily)
VGDTELLTQAQAGDADAFEAVVAPYRGGLFRHCYRMLGSPHDAEDALQESLLGAWRGIAGFEGRSSLQSWLYRIATHACLRLISRRPSRVLSPDYGPSRTRTDDLGEPVPGPVWIEPLPDTSYADEHLPAAETSYLERESVELAFTAALQQLPGNQRAVLILRDVMGYSAAEVADLLDTSVASANSALQRARTSVEERSTGTSQRDELERLGDEGQRQLVDAFVAAWESADVPALLDLLRADVRFTMPPLPAWFDGRDAVAGFLTERLFATPWRLTPVGVNGQLGFGCYILEPGAGAYKLGAVNVLTLRDGKVADITGFLDPDALRNFGLPVEPPEKFLPADR